MGNLLSKFSKRERYIFYASSVVIMAVFFDRIVIRPMLNKIENLNKQIIIQERKLQKSLKILQREESIVDEHKEYTQNITQAVSDGEEKSRLLSDIESIARKASVKLKDVKVGNTKKAYPYKKFSVELTTESKINFLMDFMYQLESSERLYRVRDFYLNPATDKSEILRAQMTVTETLISAVDEQETENVE